MTQWIRWWGLGVFVALVLLWWLCIDSIISYSIESFGSKAVGAKVEVASSELKLAPLSLSIKGLAITNPDRPMENLWYSDDIQLQLDSSFLLRRQVIVEQANVSGLQFNSPRRSSGALSKSKAKASSSPGLGEQIKTGAKDMLPDPKQVIANEKAAIKAKVDDIEQRIKTLEQQWQQRIDELPNKEDIAAYKQRWKALKKKNWLEKIADTKALQKDINQDIDQLNDLEKQLDKDKAKLKGLIQEAKELPEKEADRLLAKAGYSGGSAQLAQSLFGDQAKQWLNQLTGLFKNVASSKPAEAVKPARGEGQWITFTEQQPHPDFLIKQAKLSGNFKLLGDSIDFTGHAQDITHQAKRWPQPTRFSLQGNSTQGASFNSQGSIDLRNKPTSEMSLNVKQLSINELILSASDSMPIKLNSARLQGDAQMAISADNLAFNGKGLFTQTQFKVANTDSNSQQIIAGLLQDIDSFDLQLGLKGDIEQPELSLKSNLDKALSKAFGQQASKKMDQYKQDLRAQLSAELAPQLQGLTQDADFITAIKEQLANKQNELKVFSKGLL
ncbi:TIGR03545 family protein [Dasania sp. GY-MA-18]|uniref:TIGR03545 family protein n=1 Tax=Dasania phycosphaerae TaxID=2950436 RepID=A0A9J6RKI1_9GAMM|nr:MULTISPECIES: TIGR03545 family protein [Dasania]MCR8922478.1 TIGR03545 family protein [Dasania sp. GY-MA-18]MCZ0864906.1 TIGR03545 family protein [Dasania phycosphaerae]MCZ0868634.1 TIGR03545 family protein [Dasania phycosphaerae]